MAPTVGAELNLIADMLPTGYVQSDAVRLEIYGRIARCRTDDDLEDLEDESARRFDRLPPETREFFAAARLQARLQAARHYEARTSAPKLLRRRSSLVGFESRERSRWSAMVIAASIGNRSAKPFERINDFLELLDE